MTSFMKLCSCVAVQTQPALNKPAYFTPCFARSLHVEQLHVIFNGQKE